MAETKAKRLLKVEIRFSFLVPIRFTNKRYQHRFNLPISKKIFGDSEMFCASSKIGLLGITRKQSFKVLVRIPFSLDSVGHVEKVEVNEDEILSRRRRSGLGDLELVSSRQHKDLTGYCGICSNPIFTVYLDSVGNVAKVEVDEDEVLSRRRSGLDDLESVSSKLVYAKKLAEQMENGEYVTHKDTSLLKFVSSSSSSEEEFRFTVLVYRKSNEVECTELEKEMMRRKMKAWEERDMSEKGTVEVLHKEGLEKPLMSFEKPKFDRNELMSSISKVKGSEKKLELVNSSHVELDFDDKIHEIKVMARRAREIEAGIELNEKEKRDVNKETGDSDEDISIQSQKSLPHDGLTHSEGDDDKDERLGTSTDSENTELSAFAVPMLNGAMVDSGFPNHEMAASDKKKVSNVVPLVPTDGVIQASDVTKDQLSMMKNSTGRKSRVIRSVKEAKEFLSRRSGEKELTQELSQMAQDSDEIFPKQSDEERGVARKHKLDVDSQPQKNDYQKLSETGNAVKGSSSNKREELKSAKSSSGGTEHIEKEEPSGKENWIEKTTMNLSLEYNDELEWMKDEKLRDIVFCVRDNELADGVSVYDPLEKIIPRWKGPSLDKNPEFLNNYHEQREALFSGKAASVSPVKYEEQSSHQELSESASSENTLTPSSEITSSQPKIVVEGSDGSVRPGKKSGKEYWQHTKKWSRGFLELYNAETDPEVKAVMRDMGKDLDRWITEDEIKDAADIMEKLPERNKNSVRAGTYARDADCLFLTEKSLLMLSVLFKVYGAMVDSGFPEHEIAASDKEKVSNLVPLVPTHGIIQSSEAEYCGICSNPIFTVYLDSVGNVAKVEVDEDEVLSRRSGLDDLELVSSRLQKVLEDQISGSDKLVQLQAKFKNALEEAVLAENGVENNCRDAEISCPDSSAP
ncbi:unnamed protein product [Arabidopsis thaliana]|uniref:Uncharacterized protein n=1 Tax=Arabidopsis thaliana TaxID=3702 RepID=A0A654G4S5_ARATH|nr:unnamed protein product [Arabidopsis thaliana]